MVLRKIGALPARLILLAVSHRGGEAEDNTIKASSRIAILLPSMKDRGIF
jgi:hypothetical protein